MFFFSFFCLLLGCNIHYGPDISQPGLRIVYFQSCCDTKIDLTDHDDEEYFSHEWLAAEKVGNEQEWANALIESKGEYKYFIDNEVDLAQMDELVERYTEVTPKRTTRVSTRKSAPSPSKSTSSSTAVTSKKASTSKKSETKTTHEKKKKQDEYQDQDEDQDQDKDEIKCRSNSKCSPSTRRNITNSQT